MQILPKVSQNLEMYISMRHFHVRIGNRRQFIRYKIHKELLLALFEKEIKSISYLIKNKKRPITCIIGGSKISTKIGVLSNLIKNSDNLIIVGAMAIIFKIMVLKLERL